MGSKFRECAKRLLTALSLGAAVIWLVGSVCLSCRLQDWLGGEIATEWGAIFHISKNAGSLEFLPHAAFIMLVLMGLLAVGIRLFILKTDLGTDVRENWIFNLRKADFECDAGAAWPLCLVRLLIRFGVCGVPVIVCMHVYAAIKKLFN